jgi:hypothetical protein
MNDHFPIKLLSWITIFAIAMGFLESSVVVYLRALLYPEGFNFPLAPIPQSLALTEILREAATIIMLFGAGYLAGRSFTTRFAWFLYAFAVWDIFYYVFLKLLLNWPESFITWDILFLIPVTWVSPVICPVITSLTMIWLAIIILNKASNNSNVRLLWKDWSLLILGSVILIVSFTWDYSKFILQHYSFSKIWTIPTDDLLNLSLKYIPASFNWFLFIIGELVIIADIVIFTKRKL